MSSKLKYFVTGGCGFIGSNFIINTLDNKESLILNYDKLTYSGNQENLGQISENKNYTFINGDICNKENVLSVLNDFRPDVVVHFAAESHVDRSIDSPDVFIKTNVLGTYALLSSSFEYYSNNNKKDFKFIHISTDEVFGSLGAKGQFSEKTNYNPKSPYSASKASSDHLVRAWFNTYNFPAIITNCSNNYGPLQFPEKLIPLIIANCIDEKELPVYGDGLNIRDWLYVDDHCSAIHFVIEKGKVGETYCIGGNNEITNIDIVNKICETLNLLKPRKNKQPYQKLINFVKDRPGHDFRYAINSSKIQNELGWRAVENFDSGIIKTIKWYLENESWWRNIQKNNYKQERLGLKK